MSWKMKTIKNCVITGNFKHCHHCIFEEFTPSLPLFYSYPEISTMAALERKMSQMNNLPAILFWGNCSLGNIFRHNHTHLVDENIDGATVLMGI